MKSFDAAFAKAALHEIVKLARTRRKHAKVAALKIVLEWTKVKPAERIAMRTTLEEWLKLIAPGA